MAEQGGRGSGPAEPSNISKYWPKFSLLLSGGGDYYMEKNFDWLNLWGEGGIREVQPLS